MGNPFDIPRTVRTYRLYFDEHADVLEELLRSVDRCLDRLLPPAVSDRVDREGSSLARGADGRLEVRRHPALERARQELAGMGLFRVFLPEDVGGAGLPLAIYYLAVQLVSYHDTSLALVFLVHGNAMYAIDRHGTPAQRRRYLPALASGEQVASVAFTEPQAGSDAGGIRTRAERTEGGYRLGGDKLFITNGGDADLLITTARTGPLELGIDGVSTFLLEPRRDGVLVLGLEEKTGLQGSPTAALSYPEITIPADRLLGREGKGGAVMFAGVGMTRVNIGAQALGIGKRAFAAAAQFAAQRVQGGRPILRHDAILQRLGDMALSISAMENLICLDSRLEQRGGWHVLEMSVTKYFASEALQGLTTRAMGVLGGYGVCRAYGVERCRREAAALPLYGGTSEIQWYIIARELLGCLCGESRADYPRRMAVEGGRLLRRCRGAALEPQAQRLERARQELWDAVAQVARLPGDPAPCHHDLAELACAYLVALALLWQASAPEAGELDLSLGALAVDRLEESFSLHLAGIKAGDRRAGLKAALLRELCD